jgi:hypothetical protein
MWPMQKVETRKCTMEPQTFEVYDRRQPVRFTGHRLAHTSSRRTDDAPRWTELSIYRTVSGKYIMVTEGKSLVYHYDAQSCRGGERVRNEDIDDYGIPCTSCKPPGLDELDTLADKGDDAWYRQEKTMSSINIAHEPRHVQSMLSYRGKMTSLANDLLNQAMDNDEDLKNALSVVQTVD